MVLTHLQFIEEIGPYNFSATCSDNTGNTSKGRRLTSTKYPHILNLQDADHELSLTINEICSLDFFKPVRERSCPQLQLTDVKAQVISTLRGVVAHMNKSTYTMEHFDYQRKKMGIGRGLESIGDTRFGTLYWSGQAVIRGLPALKVIIADDNLQTNIPVSHNVELEISIDMDKSIGFKSRYGSDTAGT
jgi:hypothetical protein